MMMKIFLLADSVDVLRGIPAPGRQDMLVGGLGVVRFAVPLDHFQGARRADVQAGAHAVAIELADEDGLVFGVQLKRALGAGGRAQSAAIAEAAVDFDDFSFGHVIHLPGKPSPGKILPGSGGWVFDPSQIFSRRFRAGARGSR